MDGEVDGGGAVHESRTIAITGAAGRIGSRLRPRLRRAERRLRLLDIREPELPPSAYEAFHLLPLDDVDGMTAAFRGCDLVVHLGGIPTEAPWPEILATNIDGTRNVLEAARLAHVPRVMLASSIHAVGMHSADSVVGVPVPDVRPDGFYGVSKAASEALGSMYADRYGMSVVSLRIAAFGDRPNDQRALALWLSPADCAAAVESVLALSEPGHHVVWGVSANLRSPVDQSAGARIGFVPADDAELFAADVPMTSAKHDTYLGGAFVRPDRPPGQRFQDSTP